MYMHSPMILRLFFLIWFIAIVGCSNPSVNTPTPTLPTIPTRTATPVSSNKLSSDVVTTDPITQTIRIWTDAAVSPYGNTAAQLTLTKQIERYLADNPGVMVDVSIKNLSGPSSILNYLRTGSIVAPSIMPHIILLSSEQLAMYKNENLIFPLSIEPSEVEQWYPAAIELATIDDTIYARPFAMTNLHHLIWNSAAITETIPVDWESFVQIDNATLAFSAETNAGAALPLHLYRSTDNMPLDDKGHLQPTIPVTTAVYQLLQNGQLRDLFSIDPTILTTDDQVLEAVIANAATMGIVSASTIVGIDPEAPIDYDAIPGERELSPPLVNTLSWAITAKTPQHQLIANDLIDFLTTDINLAEWSEAAQLLPNSPIALSLWENNSYAQFIDTQLSGAIGYRYFDSPSSRTLAEMTVSFVTIPQSPQSIAKQLLSQLENNQ